MKTKTSRNKNTWLEIIYQALINLNGAAKYQSIYQEVLKLAPEKCELNENWQARVRATIQSSSSDSKDFKKKQDLFIALEGLGKGSWGIRGFINQTSYAEVIEMIDQFKATLEDWQIGPSINTLNVFLDKAARSGFRNSVIKSRNLYDDRYSDLEKINPSNHDLDMNLKLFVEAAHIFDVWCIKKIIIEHKKQDTKDDETVINLLNALNSPSNALLLPFNYHKLFDMNLIWFDETSGLMCFNREFEEDLIKLGIYPTKIKLKVFNNKEVMKYLAIRNQYRQNQLTDIWNLFQKDIVHLLNI